MKNSNLNYVTEINTTPIRNGHATHRHVAAAGQFESAANALVGADVFSRNELKRRISDSDYKEFSTILDRGDRISSDLSEIIASAMKEWASENGASHYCHWFQPLTGGTAEKHEAIELTDTAGRAIVDFSGAALRQGEPDASSFPSGGLRQTSEARGYTVWDPNSPAFLSRIGGNTTLCIPSYFMSWNGEALDFKAPLRRSIQALSEQAMRIVRLFEVEPSANRVFSSIGPEQEYFLVDEKYVDRRPDLLMTGRTLFGSKPSKHQQLDDHYFGRLPERVHAFLKEFEAELRRVGVPITTRHNEVAPGQYEIAPLYQESTIACDQQHLVMELVDRVSRRHGLRALLHEKPFAGINGSGKHVNWSMCTDKGVNLLNPTDDTHSNLQFLVFVIAILAAVDDHAELLRASIASTGNDERLGANEAPPAIMSVFLGDSLSDVMAQIESGELHRTLGSRELDLDLHAAPILQCDAGDRNRTSPFAFTGNKFEFRAVGSTATCAWPNTVLNTIVADSIDQLADALETRTQVATSEQEFYDEVVAVLQQSVSRHRRIIFEGDNYSEAWREEASRRQLPNLSNTAEALHVYANPISAELFDRHGVLSKDELDSRLEVFAEQYSTKLRIEAETAVRIANTMILPAASSYQGELASTVASTKAAGQETPELDRKLKEVIKLVGALSASSNALTLQLNQSATDNALDAARRCAEQWRPAMEHLRDIGDALESIVPARLWPLPTYAEMLHL